MAPVLVEGWLGVELPPFPLDMVISMDDAHLYVACWIQGFVAQYHVADPFRPTLVRKISLGGVLRQKSSPVSVLQSPPVGIFEWGSAAYNAVL